MAALLFHKYQGTGNDFVMIDDRTEKLDLKDHQLIAHLCHRKFGIGADGLILLRDHAEADFEMVYYNSDGCLTSLCGNGSRCAVQFASDRGMISEKCSFMTVEGILTAEIKGGLVYLKMPNVETVDEHQDHFFVNTGSPHHVCFVNNIEQYDVYNQGKKIRYGAPYFENGTNVNFVESKGASEIFVRTYERGVENETFSCGTGVTAAALVRGIQGEPSPITVHTPGGQLQISFERANKGFKNIFLVGPAKKVFEGSFNMQG
jgi:diaminopimelate epimerase